jgi:integrase
MALNLQNRRARTEGGERFSMLLAGAPLTPLFYPTVFAVEQRRSAGLAANTLWADGQALMPLLLWANRHGIELEQRFAEGNFLTATEVSSFARAAKRRLRHLRRAAAPGRTAPPGRNAPTNLEAFRSPHVPPEKGVATDFSSFRIWVAREYLSWLADKTSPYQALSDRAHRERTEAREEMRRALKSHLTGRGGKSKRKEGLTERQQSRLLEVIKPDSPENPWVQPYVRVRNQCLVTFLLGLGPRKGEALKQTIGHVDMGQLEVSIVRKPDDPNDSRRLEPNVKRVGRIVPMEREVADQLSDYISDWRAVLPGAEKTDFLFLTVKGKPMSHEAVHKVFTVLRNAVPELPDNLSSHLLRHTWNDNYSVQMDKNRVTSANEIRTRSYLMGWSETSGTAARYTQRSTRKRAAEYSRASQKRVMGMPNGNA